MSNFFHIFQNCDYSIRNILIEECKQLNIHDYIVYNIYVQDNDRITVRTRDRPKRMSDRELSSLIYDLEIKTNNKNKLEYLKMIYNKEVKKLKKLKNIKIKEKPLREKKDD